MYSQTTRTLEYFTSSKTLTWQQAWWSEYLNTFNLSLHFCPGKLGAKPDMLTRQQDVYLKEGRVTYAEANPKNTCPLFTQNHIHHTAKSTTQPVGSTPLHVPTKSSLHARTLPHQLLAPCWIWKPCIPTYYMDSCRMPRHRHILKPFLTTQVLIASGLVPVQVFSCMMMLCMFRTSEAFGPMFSSCVMITCLRAIQGRQRLSNSSVGTISGQRCMMI